MSERKRVSGIREEGSGDREWGTWESGQGDLSVPLPAGEDIPPEDPGSEADPNLGEEAHVLKIDMNPRKPVVVGITGASGAALARRAIEKLGDAGYPVIVTCTAAGMRVWKEELDESFAEFAERWHAKFALEVLDVRDIGASIASGRRLTSGMLVIPCSMDTLSAVASGRSMNLLERAADVTLKEARPLVLVPRETPLSPIHLENMLKLARIGVRIVMPVPAFYLGPQTVEEVVDDVATRAIVALGITELAEENYP